MAAPALGDKLARFWEELAEANPDTLPTNGMFSSIPAAEPGVSLGKLRSELKRLKFVFTEAEAQKRFAECAQGKRIAEQPGNGGALEVKRRESKEVNKSLKQRIAREEQLCSQLLNEIEAAYKQCKQLHEQCSQELREGELSERLTAMDDDLDLVLGADETAAHLDQAAAESFEGAENARSLLHAREDAAVKRRRLEAELQMYESQNRSNRARAGAFKREESRERALADSIRQLQEAEAQLGLPRLEIDHIRKVALLGEPPAAWESSIETEELRTLQIDFADDGKLIQAVPHPALGLETAAAKAVINDDLGALLTTAWARLCDASGSLGETDLERRLQRLSVDIQRAGA